MNSEFQNSAEALIDRLGLHTVLNEIAEVCAAKAAHIEENWQDGQTAKVWTRAAAAIERLAAREVITDCYR